jgi:phosphoadenosine phosphosulfate reductase
VTQLVTQLDLGGRTCVDRAIARIRHFALPSGEPYTLCFSGGKDSLVLKALADMAGVPYHAIHNVTTIDPPPVMRFIKQQHPDVERIKPAHGKSFAQRVAEKGMPGRHRRWCCEEFKERHIAGLGLMGLRRAEVRASGRVGLTRVCRTTGARSVQPILDWTDGEVWSFIGSERLPYCALYDQGWKRLGCVCCPFARRAEIERNRARWPMMFEAIRRAMACRWAEHWAGTDIARRFAGSDAYYEWCLRRDAPYPAIGAYWEAPA